MGIEKQNVKFDKKLLHLASLFSIPNQSNFIMSPEPEMEELITGLPR